MLYCPLGDTGYTVSRLAFGTLTVGPLAANLSLPKGAALLRKAAGLGVNFFDTAQYYRNYEYLAQGLSGLNVIIASKSYAQSREDMAGAVEEARNALKRHKIDIFLLHEVRGDGDLQERLPALEYLHQAKARGIIGAVGLSTHYVSVAALAARLPEIEVIHAMFNRRGIGIRGGGLREMRAALAAAKAAGKGVYSMKAIGGGALMNEAREALKWAFAQDEAAAVAVGMKDEAELVTNIGWLLGQEPAEAAQVKLLERNLVCERPCRVCGACIERCPQQALYKDADGVGWRKEHCLYCGYCIAACPHFCLSFC